MLRSPKNRRRYAEARLACATVAAACAARRHGLVRVILQLLPWPYEGHAVPAPIRRGLETTMACTSSAVTMPGSLPVSGSAAFG